MMPRSLLAFILILSYLIALPAAAQPQQEKLSRGLAAVRIPDGPVFVTWRLLQADAKDVAFNV